MPEFLAETYLPRDAAGAYLYQAPSAGAVRAAMTRAGLRPDRITPAILIRPPDPATSAESAAGRRAVT